MGRWRSTNPALIHLPGSLQDMSDWLESQDDLEPGESLMDAVKRREAVEPFRKPVAARKELAYRYVVANGEAGRVRTTQQRHMNPWTLTRQTIPGRTYWSAPGEMFKREWPEFYAKHRTYRRFGGSTVQVFPAPPPGWRQEKESSLVVPQIADLPMPAQPLRSRQWRELWPTSLSSVEALMAGRREPERTDRRDWLSADGAKTAWEVYRSLERWVEGEYNSERLAYLVDVFLHRQNLPGTHMQTSDGVQLVRGLVRFDADAARQEDPDLMARYTVQKTTEPVTVWRVQYHDPEAFPPDGFLFEGE